MKDTRGVGDRSTSKQNKFRMATNSFSGISKDQILSDTPSEFSLDAEERIEHRQLGQASCVLLSSSGTDSAMGT